MGEVRDGYRSPSAGNRQVPGVEVSFRTALVNAHRSALGARNHNRMGTGVSKIPGADTVGSAAIAQGQWRPGHGLESASAIAEQHRDPILVRCGDVALIRNDNEISVAVAVEVIDRNLPWLGACGERRVRRIAKVSAAIPQQDRDGGVVKICRNDIRMAL